MEQQRKDNPAVQSVIEEMKAGKELLWFNPNFDGKMSPEVTKEDVAEAAKRLERFASYIQSVYPETQAAKGIIESPIQEIGAMAQWLAENHSENRLVGRLLLKCDSMLPISGSIKARGGIYEVLCYAEKIAMEHNMLKESDDYAILAQPQFKELFSKYSIAVGSTGNLGLSIGIMSAQMGFNVAVHMSSDARQWKKDMLREKGATVVEYAGDYQKAVAEGRKQAEGNPSCHFVDDENSKTLFLGYTVAGERTKKQLDEMGIVVDEAHPLFVYLPCGVGGGPGGVAYGLKELYGDHVHCFFAEPVESPCMLLGVLTGKHDEICVQDIGLSGKTSADGLAVGRASKLVGKIVGNLLDGLYTVTDERMEDFVRVLHEKENIFIEPSAAAGFPGYYLTQSDTEYKNKISADAFDIATHIVWATGGSMVPEKEKRKYLES